MLGSAFLRRSNAFASLQQAVDTRSDEYLVKQILQLQTASRFIMLANNADIWHALVRFHESNRVFSNSQSFFFTLKAEFDKFLIFTTEIILEFWIFLPVTSTGRYSFPTMWTPHFSHLLHSHRFFMVSSLMNFPFHGIFFHFPSSLIRMTLLAMYTHVHTVVNQHTP